MTLDQLRDILKQFAQQQIVVVGDVMLDHYLWGKVSRISPEAPVPVVEVTRESYFPGGAANVARNLRALGAAARIMGVLGEDDAGQKLRSALEEQGIPTDGLIVDSTRPTTLKTRIVAHNQQVVRFDHESNGAISSSIQDQLLRHFSGILPEIDAVIFEDYAKGLFTQGLVNQMLGQARDAKIVTAADPNPRRLLDYREITALTPNRSRSLCGCRRTLRRAYR